jgi:hypothetical protein
VDTLAASDSAVVATKTEEDEQLGEDFEEEGA